MLWAADNTKLPNNYFSSLVQLKSLEKRLAKDEDLREKYISTIKKDLNQGYVIEVPDVHKVENQSDKEWYLPHHPVWNPNKPGKVRRVLNGAVKFHGVPLNKSLLTGPDLLQNLNYVLLSFRKQPYAVSADIEGMLLQVCLLPSGQPSFRFLWREDPKTNVVVYQFTRHIFGAKNCPHAPNMHFNALRETTQRFNPKLQKPSLKTFTWTIISALWSLLRRPSIDRRNWYIFSILVGTSLQNLKAMSQTWLIELMVLFNLLNPRLLFHDKRINRTCLG